MPAHPEPKGRANDRQGEQQEIAHVKQRVTVLEQQLSSLQKELEARKQFFAPKQT